MIIDDVRWWPRSLSMVAFLLSSYIATHDRVVPRSMSQHQPTLPVNVLMLRKVADGASHNDSEWCFWQPVRLSCSDVADSVSSTAFAGQACSRGKLQ